MMQLSGMMNQDGNAAHSSSSNNTAIPRGDISVPKSVGQSLAPTPEEQALAMQDTFQKNTSKSQTTPDVPKKSNKTVTIIVAAACIAIFVIAILVLILR